jgi:outer membrane protein assembly factor BamB
VVFENGEVQGQRDGTWSDLEIGARLGKGDSVKVGPDSECQLKFANLAVVSIRENTQVSLDSLTLSTSGSQVKLALESGTVLSKVKKLSGKESFTVRTQTAVGGVRGTEFGVTVTPQGGTLVTVKEGTVAVLPAACDPDAVRSLSADVPALEQIARQIESSAPAVHAGQELTVTPEQAAKAEVAFQYVRASATRIVQEQQVQAARQTADASSAKAAASAAQAVPTAPLEEQLKSLQAATATLTSIIDTPTTALTPVHGEALKPLDVLPAPNAPVSGRSSAAPVHVSLAATPADSVIELNGKPAGTGSYDGEAKAGDTLTFAVRHEGYAAKTVTVIAGDPATRQVQLQPVPIEAAFPVGNAPLAGVVQSSGDLLLAADRQGTLYASTRQGRALWKVSTRNSPNENSSPVIGAENLYFTGSKEFLVVALRTGAVVRRAALDGATTHLFGQRVAVTSSLGISPTSTSLAVFNPATGAPLRRIPIAGGTLMTPTMADGRVLVVSQAGVLLAVDPVSAQVLFQVPTGAGQAVASSVRIAGSRAFFADRKGLVVCVDIEARKVLWKVPLKLQGAGGVFQDLELSAQGVFAFAGNTIYALSAENGAELFPPIGGASTPPFSRAGRLYFGTQSGTLAVADPGTGRIVKSLDLKNVACTRPQPDGPRLLVGTAAGQLLVIYPDSIQ